MDLLDFAFSPPKRLAVAYMRADLRDVFRVLLALDDRLSAILRRSGEPMIAQMRMAWWNDVITKPASLRPTGEPLLARIADFETPDFHQTLLLLIEAWSILLAHEIWTQAVLEEYARQRSMAIFGFMAGRIEPATKHIGASADVGFAWALDDLAGHCHDEGQLRAIHEARRDRLGVQRIPRSLRALHILAASARYEQSPRRFAGFRLMWHALTGF